MAATNSVFRTSLRRTALCTAALAGLAAAPAPAAAGCDPISFLFGGCRQVRAFDAQPASEPLRLRAQNHRGHATTASRAGKPRAQAVKPAKVRKFVSDAPVGSLERFAADPTVRNGDIVVTNKGFQVFRNKRFTSIAHDGGKLARLEGVSMRPRSARVTMEVASSSKVERRGLIALRSAIRVASRADARL
ncbi:MAG: hypothetical protein ACK5JM_01490 [Rhodoblastus sp.]